MPKRYIHGEYKKKASNNQEETKEREKVSSLCLVSWRFVNNQKGGGAMKTLSNGMRVVCAWCGITKREGNPLIGITHGICKPCACKEKAKLNK